MVILEQQKTTMVPEWSSVYVSQLPRTFTTAHEPLQEVKYTSGYITVLRLSGRVESDHSHFRHDSDSRVGRGRSRVQFRPGRLPPRSDAVANETPHSPKGRRKSHYADKLGAGPETRKEPWVCSFCSRFCFLDEAGGWLPVGLLALPRPMGASACCFAQGTHQLALQFAYDRVPKVSLAEVA